MSWCCHRSTSPIHVPFSSRSMSGSNLILFMGLVKVCYRQNVLHQNFYKTPKTKYNIYLRRKLMYDHQNLVFHLFSISAATLEDIFKVQLFKNYSVTFALDDIKKFLISKHARTYVLLTWIKICHMPYARFHMICHALFLLKTTIPYLTWLYLFSSITYLNSAERKKNIHVLPCILSQSYLQSFNFCQLLVQIIYLFQYISQNRVSSRKQQSYLRELHFDRFI